MREITGAEMLLSKMWRGNGVHQLGVLGDSNGMRPVYVSSIEDAIAKADTLCSQGVNVFFACAEYITNENRKGINASGAWGYWFDIDCGTEKAAKGLGYPTKNEANKALLDFVKKTNLPYPDFIVDSGNGLHVYFCSDEFIPKNDWEVVASKLKVLTQYYGLLADPSRTADIASVLRVPNTKNYKDPSNPKAVKVVFEKNGESLRDISSAINAAYMTVEEAKKQAEPMLILPAERLGATKTTALDPYPYDENKEDYFAAHCAAYPNPTSREDWRTGICALAYLVVAMAWPETEVRQIRVTWENLAVGADKTDNETQWIDALERTKEKIKSNESTITHLTILKKARENGWKPQAQSIDALAATQSKFALISLGGKVGIIDKQELSATSSDGSASRLVVMNRNDGGLLVSRFLACEFSQVDAQKTLVTFLRDKNTTLYSGVEFNPRNTSPNALNLWVGETIKPVKGQWPLIQSLLLDVLCGGRQSEYQYLVKYIAHALQRPWEKPGVMIILLGGQGIGKGTLAKILQRIWSATFLQANRIKQIVGDFNGSLERAFIVFLDEALFVGDRNSSDALKSLVTEQTISINEKHQPARQITSYHRFVSATNADWFKSTDRDDRRDFVLRVSEHRKGDFEFWNALNKEIENGGVEAFAHELLNMDLTDFNVRAKPNTRELTEQKLQSLDKFPRWWFSVLSRGYIRETDTAWPEFIGTTTLLSSYQEHEKNTRSYKNIIERDIAGFMLRMCPSASKDRSKEGLHRRHGFRLPSIETARSDFESYIGDKVTWEDAPHQV